MKSFILAISLFFFFITSAHSVQAACGTIAISSPGNIICSDGLTNFPGTSCTIHTNIGEPCCATLFECRPANPPVFDVDTGPTNQTFNAVNPLTLTGPNPQAQQFSTPGGIISRVLDFAFPIAGFILFVMIVWGGFEILAGANEKKSLDAGKQRVTAAIVGFLLLFSAYWIAQIVEFIFGVVIL